MERIPENRDSSGGYYLPHHGVVKVTSETTKLRVVFDGSAATSTVTSLNDKLHTGPKLQDDLIYMLLRFRIHRYVLTYDEEYRFPHAARILLRDFYVDDALTGASTIEEARTLRDDLIQLLELAGLNIRQWAANDEALLDGLSD